MNVKRPIAIVFSLIVAGLLFCAAAPQVAGEEPAKDSGKDASEKPKYPGYESCGDVPIMVHIADGVEVLAVEVRGDTPRLSWECESTLEKVSGDVFVGEIAFPHVVGFKQEDCRVRFDVLVKETTQKNWITLSKKLDSYYVFTGKELLDRANGRDGPSVQVSVLVEYQLDKALMADCTAVKQHSGWLTDGAVVTDTHDLGGGRFVVEAAATWAASDDYSTLKADLEITHKDGTSTKTGWKTLKELGGKILKMAFKP